MARRKINGTSVKSTTKSTRDEQTSHRGRPPLKLARWFESPRLDREWLAKVPNGVRRAELIRLRELDLERKRRQQERRLLRRQCRLRLREIGLLPKSIVKQYNGTLERSLHDGTIDITRVGRATSFDFRTIPIIRGMALSGSSDKQIAEFLGISPKTFEYWAGHIPLLVGALKDGRQFANANVAKSLYRQAVGYTIPEEKIFYDSKRGRAVRVRGKKFYAPNPVPGIFWMKNKDPDNWKDTRQVEQTGSGELPREVRITVVRADGEKSKDNKIIDADFRVLDRPQIEDKRDVS